MDEPEITSGTDGDDDASTRASRGSPGILRSRRFPWHAAGTPSRASSTGAATGHADLLVSSGGGRHGRSAWLYRPSVAPVRRARPPATTRECACRSSTACGASARSRTIVPAGSTWWRSATTGWWACPTRAPRRNRSSAAGSPWGWARTWEFRSARIVQMTAVDWDQDGLTDLLVGVLDVNGYWPDSGPAPARPAGRPQPEGGPSLLRPPGTVARSRSLRPSLLASQRRASAASPASSFSPRSPANRAALDIGLHPAPLAVSWGGRGSLELLVSDHRGLLRVYRNFGGQLPPVLMEPRTLQCGGAPLLLHDDRIAIAAGDIDGDRQDRAGLRDLERSGLLRAPRPVAERGPGAHADPPPGARAARSVVTPRSSPAISTPTTTWISSTATRSAGFITCKTWAAATITAMPGRWCSRPEALRSGSSPAPTGCFWGRPATVWASPVPRWPTGWDMAGPT